MTRTEQLEGVLLGLALGDALGLPLEGLSPRRARRLFGEGPLRHRLLPGGGGLVSDDTEHACLVGQALLVAPQDAARFGRALAWRMRGWLPAARVAAGPGRAARAARACGPAA